MKTPKIRSEKHRRFVASLPCCVCGASDVQAAHIRSNTGGGMSLKPGDDWCVPLCCRCHAKQHKVGEREFWGDRLDDAKGLAQTLYFSSIDRIRCLDLIRAFQNVWRFK